MLSRVERDADHMSLSTPACHSANAIARPPPGNFVRRPVGSVGEVGDFLYLSTSHSLARAPAAFVIPMRMSLRTVCGQRCKTTDITDSTDGLGLVLIVKLVNNSPPMRRHMIGIHVSSEFKAELQLEAWHQRLTLAAYVRQLLERTKTPGGRLRIGARMRKRGRPPRSAAGFDRPTR